MKSKAFTLIELLAVIAILALLMAIAVPSVLTISEKMRKDMYCDKVDFIENGAQLWGEDHYEQVFNTANKSLEVGVGDLVNAGYLNKDSTDESGNKIIQDPRDDSSLNDRIVRVFIKNTRIYAEFKWTADEEGLCD